MVMIWIKVIEKIRIVEIFAEIFFEIKWEHDIELTTSLVNGLMRRTICILANRLLYLQHREKSQMNIFSLY